MICQNCSGSGEVKDYTDFAPPQTITCPVCFGSGWTSGRGQPLPLESEARLAMSAYEAMVRAVERADLDALQQAGRVLAISQCPPLFKAAYAQELSLRIKLLRERREGKLPT